jgi:hypothetical protein
VASAPVSASPSPMMQATIRSGLSKCSAKGVDQGITQFAAFMDRPGSFRRDMTRYAIRPGELPKQPLQSVSAALDIREAFGLGPFEIAMGHQAGICGPICARTAETQSRPCQPRPCIRADGDHLSAKRGAPILSVRILEDRGPLAFCGAVSCPANASATTGFMLSTIDVGIRIVAPRSLVVS